MAFFVWSFCQALTWTWFSISIYIAFWSDSAFANVEIVEPYHPLYIKEGDKLEIKCISNNRRELVWQHQTPLTAWEETKIIPTVGADWTIRTMLEEPTGYVESILVKRNIRAADRGMYVCQDSEATYSFSIWVTALSFSVRNVTATEDGEPVTLHCNMTGFDTNPPRIDQHWVHKKYLVDTESEGSRFTRSKNTQGYAALTISEPNRGDTGDYECHLTLYTNLGPLTLKEVVHLDATRLTAGVGKLSVTHTTLLIMGMIYAICYSADTW